jgi:hypothetical protein
MAQVKTAWTADISESADFLNRGLGKLFERL